MEKEILTRQQFYTLVWSIPMSQLAKKYALSDNGLRKLCVKYHIPIPRNGYWQKVKYNKTVKAEKLPYFSLEPDKIELMLREEGKTVNYDQSPLIRLTKEIQNDPKAPLTVPDHLQKPHRLIESTRLYWNHKTQNQGSRAENPYEHLSIRVQSDTRKRALRFMNALIRLLKYRGHHMTTKGFQTIAVIHEIEIELDLRQATKRIPPASDKPYDTSQYVPVDELILKVGQYSGEKEWRDGKNRLEMILARIVAYLELYAAREKESQERSRLWHIEYEEKIRIQEELRQKREMEARKMKELMDQAERYIKAEQLRGYIAAAIKKAELENRLDSEMREWETWAMAKADWMDPLVDRKDELLD